MSPGVAEGSETAGDFLFDLGHADIALGVVVGERGVDGGAAASSVDERHCQVFGTDAVQTSGSCH